MSDFDETPQENKPEEKKEPPTRSIWFSRFNMNTPITTGDAVKDAEESTLRFGVYRDNPRIEVLTNEPSDQQNNYGKIVAAMDPGTWQVLCDYIQELCKPGATGKETKVLENYNLYKGGERFDSPQLINRTVVTRSEEGMISIKLVEEGRPSPVFVFGPPRFHALLRSDKSQVPPGEASQIYAKATMKILSEVMAAFIAQSHHKAPEANKPVQTKQGAQGAWQNRQGGQSGQTGQSGYQGNGSNSWGNRSGGGGRSNWQNNRQGGWQNRQGGGGWQNRQGGYNKGNWQNNRGGGGGSSYQAQKAAQEMTDDDIPF